MTTMYGLFGTSGIGVASSAVFQAPVAGVPLVDEVVGLNEARAFQREHSAPTYVTAAGDKHWTFGDHATADKES